jgi:hypothetical protein
MDPEIRNEVREMLTDIISGPLEKINGQYRLMSAQLTGIEIQTTKTNGTVKCHESEINKLDKRIGSLETTALVTDRLGKKAKSNLNLIVVGIGVFVTLCLGVINLWGNTKQIKTQALIKQTIIEMAKDSTLNLP